MNTMECRLQEETNSMATQTALSTPKIINTIFKYMNRSDNARNAQVCRAWNCPAVDTLWKEATPAIFLSLADGHVNAFGSILFTSRPTIAQQQAFQENCKRVIIFQDDTHTACQKYSYNTILSSMQQPIRGLFQNLTTLRIGIQNTMSFIAPTVTTLSLLFSPDLFVQDRKAMSQVIKHLRNNLPNVTTLAITGGERIARYSHYIIRIVHGFKRLRHIILCPSAYTLAVFKTLSQSPALESISVMEFDKVFSRSRFRSSEPALGKGVDTTNFRHDAFHNLRRLDITLESCEDLIQLLQNNSFPSSQLTVLWARFSSGPAQSPSSISLAIQSISRHCERLQKLTLRLGPFHHGMVDMAEHAEPISLRHFLSIFDLPLLTDLAIDHSLPIALTEKDVDLLVDKCILLEVLWLNPFPVTKYSEHGDIYIPDVTILGRLAIRCHRLRRLGILIDARTSSVRNLPPRKFSNLRELFLGCSELPELPEPQQSRALVWEELAIYLFTVLPSFTEFTTSREYSSLALLSSPPVSSFMRPAFVSIHEFQQKVGVDICSWIAVLGMTRWLRSHFHPDDTYRSLCYES